MNPSTFTTFLFPFVSLFIYVALSQLPIYLSIYLKEAFNLLSIPFLPLLASISKAIEMLLTAGSCAIV